MKLKLLAGAALCGLFAASGASAQAPNGVYGAVDLGYHAPEGIEAESSSNAPDGRPYDWTFDGEDSFAGFARIGYRLSPQFRVELEGGYRGGEVESVRGSGNRGASYPVGLCTQGVFRSTANPTCGAPQGVIEAHTLMANAIYDLNFSFFQRFVPFVGVGVGINRTNIDLVGQFSNVGTVTAANPQFQNLVIDDEDVSFAYQGLLGLSYNATDRLAVDLTYRYLTGSDVDYISRGSATGGLQPGTFSGSYDDQSLTLGLRYSFAAPPPPPPVVEPAPVEAPPPPVVEAPPPPPPPPAPVFQPREFLVYFPFDQSILTPEAQTVVQEAASYAAAGGATRIAVTGHADTSGSAAYNIRLSERRARAVADSMVGLGVNPALITADWRGEAEPAVSTGDGVKEPLNRRATVAIN
ncbi:MAG: OmpA family protein [Proteobacteria bacterium]|nr:OmpA family protein [Pseudomonadota bacterium]MBW3618235.1 OmpA family protein [Pseudomonadota bacterium]